MQILHTHIKKAQQPNNYIYIYVYTYIYIHIYIEKAQQPNIKRFEESFPKESIGVAADMQLDVICSENNTKKTIHLIKHHQGLETSVMWLSLHKINSTYIASK